MIGIDWAHTSRMACPRFFHGWLGRSRRKLEKKHREKDLAGIWDSEKTAR